MFCTNCGSNIPDDAAFCVKCGTPTNDEPVAVKPVEIAPQEVFNPAPVTDNHQETMVVPEATPPVVNNYEQSQTTYEPTQAIADNYVQPQVTPQKPKKNKTIKIVLISVISFFVVLVGLGAFLVFTSPVLDMQKAISEKEYGIAVECYNNEIRAIEKPIANKLLSGFIKNTYEKFDATEIEYVDAYEAVVAITLVNDEKTALNASETLSTIIERNESITAFAEAEMNFDIGDYVLAIQNYEKIQEGSKEYESAITKLEEAKEKYKEEVLKQTVEPQTIEEYPEFISIVTAALDVLKNDADLTARKENLEIFYIDTLKNDAITTINNLVGQNDFIGALDLIYNTITKIGQDNELEELEKSTIQNYVNYVKTTVSANGENFPASLQLIDQTLATLSDNEELINLKNSTITAFIANVSQKVENLKTQDKYDEAITLISDALNTLQNNQELNDLLKKTQDSKPVNLFDLGIVESFKVDPFGFDGTRNDVQGNVYSTKNLLELWTTQPGAMLSSAKINLDNKYSSFEFDIAVNNMNIELERTGIARLCIYGNDNKLLYTQDQISTSTEPTSIVLDVTGTTELCILVEPQSIEPVTVLICNPRFYK